MLAKLLPESSILLAAALMLLPITRNELDRYIKYSIAAICITLAISGSIFGLIDYGEIANGQTYWSLYSIHPISQQIKVILSLIAGFTLFWTIRSREIPANDKLEFTFFTLTALLGFQIIVSASNLVLLFFGFEIAGLSSTVLAGFNRKSAQSSEAGLKKYVNSIFASAVFGVAILFMYALAGNMELATIRDALIGLHNANSWHGHVVTVFIFSSIFLSFAVKFGVFPMHFLKLDAVSGSVFPASFYISASAPVAALGAAYLLFIQLFSQAKAETWYPSTEIIWTDVMSISAILTMFIGSIGAFKQSSLKRFVGYIALSKVGVIMTGVIVSTEYSIASSLIDLLAFTFGLSGLTGGLQSLMDEAGSESKSVLKNLVIRSPQRCALLSIYMLATIGLPPFGGFISGTQILSAAIQHGLSWMAIAVALNWIFITISALYVLIEMFKTDADGMEKIPANSFSESSVLILMIIPTVGVGVFADGIMRHLLKLMN